MSENPKIDDPKSEIPKADNLKSSSKESKHSRWSLAESTNSLTYEIEAWSYLQHKDFEIHLLQKEEIESKTRPRIPTTEKERLAYYWAYFTSAFKLQISYLQPVDYTGFFWLYLKNVMLKTLPTNYIHIFLAAYNPDEHLFGSKMIPILHGISWQVVLCGLLQLVACADCLALYVHYAYIAFNYRHPWSSCSKNWSRLYHSKKKMYRCVDLKGFQDLTSSLKFAGDNPNTSFHHKYNFYYLPQNDTLFTISYLRYFIWSKASNLNGIPSCQKNKFGQPLTKLMSIDQANKYKQEMLFSLMSTKWVKLNTYSIESYYFLSNVCIVWVVATLFYNQLYRRYLWKTLYRLQLVVNLFYIMTVLYIFAYGLEVGFKSQDSWLTVTNAETIDLAKVNPARDSALVTASSSFMYLLKGFVYYRLKLFIEHRIQAPLYVSTINPYPVFYLWALFFDTLLFGSVISRIFYIILFLKEFILFIITYQLLIDVILCEWKGAKRWVTTVLMTALGLTLSLTLLYNTKMLLYILTTAITSLTEVVVVCWLYPVKRLTDDIHFHNGTPAANWRILGLKILPMYFIYKTYVIFHTLMVDVHEKLADHQKNTVNADLSSAKWVWVVGVLPLPVGALYAVFKYVNEKQVWRDLLNPRVDWGPREYLARQLRKQFESKTYVGSQASRYLSRHMITKAEPITYKLDLCYDDSKRRPTSINGYQGEWKNI